MLTVFFRFKNKVLQLHNTVKYVYFKLIIRIRRYLLVFDNESDFFILV